MKKLLFITYSLGKLGGVQTVLTNLVNELCNKYDITILCLDGNEEFVYNLDPRIKTVVLNSFGNTKSYKTMVFMNKYLSKLPKKQNIKNYIYQYGVYCLLKKWLKKNHQNYQYIISCRYTLSAMLSVMKKINKKTYAWEHTNYTVGGLFWNNIMHSYFKKLKGIIYLNNESGEHYKKINTNSTLIRNIIGIPFEGTPFIRAEEKKDIVLYVGRLHPEKNIKEIIDIFYNIKNPENWKLHLIGEGPDKNYIENFIKENNVTNIKYLGQKNKEEVYQYMKKTKILVLASETECLPTVLLESMFCSNVLISYDCKFGPANIINENNGFLIKSHDKEDFTKKIQLLIDNKELLNKLNESSYNESRKWEKDNFLALWKTLFK